MKRRAISLLLTFIMLTTCFPVTAFAGDAFFAGSGGTVAGSPGGSNTGWSSNNDGAGLLIHVEQTPVEYELDFTSETDAANTTTQKYAVVNQDEILQYWTQHFPNTNPDDGELDGFYLIPKRADAGFRPAAIQMKTNGSIIYSQIMIERGAYMMTPNANLKNWGGQGAYETADNARKNPHNPNYHLNDHYWRNYINRIEEGDCSSIIRCLFSSDDPYNGFSTQSQSQAVNERVLAYLGQVAGKNDWHTLEDKDREVALFLNYCGLIAVAIKTMPSYERDELGKQLDEMCQSYLKGKGYRPMVITAEVLVPSEYAGNNKKDCCWWTPQQCLYGIYGWSMSDDLVWQSKKGVEQGLTGGTYGSTITFIAKNWPNHRTNAGGGSSEEFNSMTGTPTFTETHENDCTGVLCMIGFIVI